jgi:hypothetical protein
MSAATPATSPWSARTSSSAIGAAVMSAAALAGAAELGVELAGGDQVGEDLELELGDRRGGNVGRGAAESWWGCELAGGEPPRVPLQGDDGVPLQRAARSRLPTALLTEPFGDDSLTSSPAPASR